MNRNPCNSYMVKGALSIQVLTACGKVAPAHRSLPSLPATHAGATASDLSNVKLPTSNVTHGDNAYVQAMASNTVHRKAY